MGGLDGDHRLPGPRARARLVRSPAYQEILPLRTENSDGATIIVEGVDEGYRAAASSTDDAAGCAIAGVAGVDVSSSGVP